MVVVRCVHNNSKTKMTTQNEWLSCKHCSKKVVNKVKCIKCCEYFHPKCLKQSNEQRKTDCTHEADNKQTDDTTYLTEENYLREENKLLRQISADKEAIIADKEKVISLLQEKIKYLEEKLTLLNGKPVQKRNQADNTTINDFVADNERIPKKDETKNSDSVKQTSKRQTENCSSPLGTSSGQGNACYENTLDYKQKNENQTTLENKQISLMNEVIYLGDMRNSTEGFKQVARKSSYRKINTGTGNGDSNFHGLNERPKKIWLFVTRVPDHIKEENIKRYIETHPQIKQDTEKTQIEVKKLSTYNVKRNYQSFIVGATPNLKEKLYDPHFWPKNIGFERFDFRRGKHLLDEKKIENSEQPASFLERN